MTYVKTYLPTLKTHVVNLKRDAKDLSPDRQRLEVRGKLGSKTLYCWDESSRRNLMLSWFINEMIKLTCIRSGNTAGRLAFVCSLYPKLFIRHFLSSGVNRYAYLFASNVIAEFVGLIDYIMSCLICEHKTGWQWKSNIQENSKWNWHVIKKMS